MSDFINLAAYYVYKNFCERGNVDIPGAVAAGMVPLEDLVDGATYTGHCRNASRATWSAERKVFKYLRYKLGVPYEEEINHPSMDQGFDIFVPMKRME